MSEVAVSQSPMEVRTEKIVRRSSGEHHYVRIFDQPVFECRTLVDWASVHDVSSIVRSTRGATIATAEDWHRFRLLADKWRKERGVTSSVAAMSMCPSYQRIIGMGLKAVPMILHELKNERDDPDHWFWALEMITGADPVPVDAYGDTGQMAKAWLSWAEGQYGW